MTSRSSVTVSHFSGVIYLFSLLKDYQNLNLNLTIIVNIMAEGHTEAGNLIEVRQAKKEDMSMVAEMIQELADFEKMPGGPKMSVKDLEHDGFVRQPPAFQCKIAELKGLANNPVVGYALYFPTYSTWEGRAMMLEDLYVRNDQRLKGIGKKLFKAVAKEAQSTGCTRLDFHVLEWNPAKAFYEKKGAENLTKSEQWCYYRLAGDALQKYTENED